MFKQTFTLVDLMIVVAIIGVAASTTLADFPGAPDAPREGMTWALSSHDATFGVDLVSCHGGGVSCDAYSGDTSCFQALPVLCVAVDGASNPGVTTSTYGEWASGHVATTLPVRGVHLSSLATADQICRDAFGAAWRKAEFHDGWGWGFHALGHVRDDSRFWVYIDDQPANRWD